MLRVSICVVAYNEEKYLGGLLNDILSQTYPHNMIEIVLIDSMSEDKTRQIMNEFKENHRLDFLDIKVLDNPKRIQAAGWNVAIDSYTGDVLSRIDAHTHIMPDFVEKAAHDLEQGEMIVGGKRPCIIEEQTEWADVLLRVENSLFGSSINPSKRESRKQYVKTVFHASYKREVFEKAGHFNESLLRTEDNEMHYRMRKEGFRICYDPEIVSFQYARSSLKKMIKQKYGNGYWIGFTLKTCPGCISIYHLIPGAFVLSIVFTSLFAMFGIWQLAALMWGAYAFFCFVSTVLSSRHASFNRYLFIMPALFLILHLAYGTGTIAGLFKRGK